MAAAAASLTAHPPAAPPPRSHPLRSLRCNRNSCCRLSRVGRQSTGPHRFSADPAEKCMACEAGSFAATAGSAKCTSCTQGTNYQDAAGPLVVRPSSCEYVPAVIRAAVVVTCTAQRICAHRLVTLCRPKCMQAVHHVQSRLRALREGLHDHSRPAMHGVPRRQGHRERGLHAL